MLSGDILHNFHCPGYDLEVLYTNTFWDGSEEAVGRCGNPACPSVCGCGEPCHYDGIITIDQSEYPVAAVKE